MWFDGVVPSDQWRDSSSSTPSPLNFPHDHLSEELAAPGKPVVLLRTVSVLLLCFMMPSPAPLRAKTGAILLAGGRSTRMGSDKAFLSWSGKTLLERLLEELQPIVTEVVIMRAPDQPRAAFPQFPEAFLRWGQDSQPDQGPLQGIADALPLLSPDLNQAFVLSCDLPRLTTDWLSRLQQAGQAADVACTEHQGIANPLLAWYRRDVLEQAPRLRAEGKRRPLALWEGFQVVSVVPEQAWEVQVQDANTPEAFAALQFPEGVRDSGGHS